MKFWKNLSGPSENLKSFWIKISRMNRYIHACFVPRAVETKGCSKILKQAVVPKYCIPISEQGLLHKFSQPKLECLFSFIWTTYVIYTFASLPFQLRHKTK